MCVGGIFPSRERGASAFAQGPLPVGAYADLSGGSLLISSAPGQELGCLMASVRLIATVFPVTLSSAPDKVLP